MSSMPPMRSRHTPRLQGHDYSQPGTYFITICAVNRECIFGEVIEEHVQCNMLGDIVAQDWVALPQHFSSVAISDYVVMPNHMHGILTLDAPTVSEDKSRSLSVIMGSFKSGVSRRINVLRDTPGTDIWQRSFHDRLVRSERELFQFQKYIAGNPLRWALDVENPVHFRR